ncbi:Shikimate kinase [Crenothrix polyspora]|uniref:Shikimate kinase n=1 Tax=Crenothrix polyspora TaxID=360316 RepID=A0A1R4HEN7_9GAMM|nr:shikimate kinase [Crenothrix polyspora]SJM94666.1 Shikimate kinase [Crenothrix polyspora]
MSEPLVNIYLIGFMGCGKSYWGRKLSQKLEIPSCDIDHIIEIKEKSKVSDIFYNNGEDYFRKKEYQVLQDLISINEACIVSCGGTPCFNNNMELMNSHGITIYLKASKEYLFNHLKINRKIRPSIAKLNDTELRNFIDITDIPHPLFQICI